MVAKHGGDDLPGFDEAVLFGPLKNLKSLQNLDGFFGHLDAVKCKQLSGLIKYYQCLSNDTPTCTHLFNHDFDVGKCKPVKQRFYHAPPLKKNPYFGS